ncbi:MAG: DUF4299 family protein [Acetatifactor sp.]|nr:DUF4299 family protein [Acetatifactor sp.]
MSIEVTIRQKGLFKKALPLDVIVGKELKYGCFDGLRLSPGELGETEFIFYHPARIGRGTSVVWKQGEKEKVDLRILTPACDQELGDFYECVRRIAEFWKGCEILLEGESKSLSEFMESKTSMLEFNQSILRSLGDEEKSISRAPLMLYCAFWPLSLSAEDLKQVSQGFAQFRDYLHSKQSVDAYYAKPSFYRDNNDNLGSPFGAYACTEDTPSIFPIVPKVPLGIVDDRTGKQLEVNKWVISLFSITENRVVCMIDYAKFLEAIPEELKKPYDAENILIEGISLELMKRMAEQP